MPDPHDPEPVEQHRRPDAYEDSDGPRRVIAVAGFDFDSDPDADDEAGGAVGFASLGDDEPEAGHEVAVVELSERPGSTGAERIVPRVADMSSDRSAVAVEGDEAPVVVRAADLARPAGRGGRTGGSRPQRERVRTTPTLDEPAAAAPEDERASRRRRSGERSRRSGPPEPPADPVAEAKTICLRQLEVRSRTRQELAQTLRRKGIPDDAADQVLERFGEVGLIDDKAFADQWVRSRHTYSGLGRRAIAVELRRKGVDSEAAGEALAEIDDASEEARARALVDRKLRTRSGVPDEAMARRLLGMLARKGYPAGIAYRVVKEAVAEHAAELADQIPDGDD
ncbi:MULTISPECIES: recombination regulator RecX [unclassified Pseudonocardia]|uniref:recombination regulator RecX n=1 Tax=unclassified Pseudonocardia TaxID=2619320 RepID=UPI0025F96BCB|nr:MULTISPECIES: recombination regulator RecX [unclassified Pseudonocardia]